MSDLEIDENESFVFNPVEYMQKLSLLMRSDDAESSKKLDDLVEAVWKCSGTDFYSESYSLDSGSVSKLSSSLVGMKRIAGTQRLMAPPTIRKTVPDLGGSSAIVPPLPKKLKKIVPIIDDSVSSSTDQPCKICSGVSVAGNNVLACTSCNDCYHMKCASPIVSMEDATEPKFNFVCSSCVKTRRSASRSSSPQVRSVEMGRKKQFKSGVK